MTIHGWGSPIYMSQLGDEFGVVSTPRYMHQYYAGGETVPAGCVGYPSGGGAVAIPASGWISLNNFYGATRVFGTYTIVAGVDPGLPYIHGFYVGAFGSCTPMEVPFGVPATSMLIFQCDLSGEILQLIFASATTNNGGGWTNININRGGAIYNYTKASAYYSADGQSWGWTIGAATPFYNGQTSIVTFT